MSSEGLDRGLVLDAARVTEIAAAVMAMAKKGPVKLMATLIHALKARGKRYGLQTMCEGGGMANATIIELL